MSKPREKKIAVKQVGEIFRRLDKEHIEAGRRLIFSGSYQALIAVVLSAQTNDHQVNRVTPRFFVRFPNVEVLGQAEPAEVETYIKSVGLFRSKAANLVAAARMINTEYQGVVPNNFLQLLSLPGVGRKTANVLLATVFDQPGLGVDTHVLRVSNRLGLAHSDHPEKVEIILKSFFPSHQWG
ncbi:MAG: endonuclease III domain-containing protein, partial [Methylocystaceae bacterium]